MTRLSQNGWPAYADTSHFVRMVAECAGGDFPFWAANADVGVVLKEYIERFDREVEPVTQKTLDDWSYANRLVRGSTSVVSNHGSATAIDLNALQHPRGVHKTFTPAKAKAVRRIKDDITDDSGVPVLRLGLDFTTTVDDMHVEINTGPRRVREAAEKIRKRKEDDVKVEFTDDQLKKLGAAMLDTPIKLTEAAAAAIGGDTKEGDEVSLRYAIQWSPLVRRLGREDAARDQQLQRTVDDLALAVGQLSRHPATGGVDIDALATAVADKLASRLKS